MDTFTLALTNLMQYWNEDYLVLAYILFTTGFNGLSLNFDNSSLNIWINNLSTAKFEAGVAFDNSFFDNYFDFLRQLKNGSFLGPVFIHVTGRSKN